MLLMFGSIFVYNHQSEVETEFRLPTE